MIPTKFLTPAAQSFIAWVEKPEGKRVYRKFEQIARSRYRRNPQRKVSAKDIFAYLRLFHGESINNNLVTPATQLAIQNNPKLAKIFETRV